MAKSSHKKFNRKRNSSESSSEMEETPESRLEAFCGVFKICIKRFIAFLFSHVGLTCAVVGYTILGGLIFKEIELPEEKQTRDSVGTVKDQYVELITDFFYNEDKNRVLEKNYWNQKMNKILRDYEVEIFTFTKEKNWDGQFEGEAYQWSFVESLLYSVTVITTIGYGNITPKTTFGRLFTIVYGTLGIPLTMLCLGNIGNLMAGLFRVIYRCACVNMTYQYIKLKRRRLRQRFVKRLQNKAKGVKAWAKRNQSFMSSVLSKRSSTGTDSPSTMSKLRKLQKSKAPSRRHSDGVLNLISRSKDHIKDIPRKHSLCVKGLGHSDSPLLHRVLVRDLSVIPENEPIETNTDNEDKVESKSSAEDIDKVKESRSRSSTVSSLSLHDFDDDERILKTRLKTTRDLVPISMCLLLMIGYIILGALIFTSWEENWNFLISFYFCFITLTTIGFGDFVPGMGKMDDDERSVFCTIYLFFGMALLAMSFHLIQEEVKHKFRKLAERIGLIEGKINNMLDKYSKDD